MNACIRTTRRAFLGNMALLASGVALSRAVHVSAAPNAHPLRAGAAVADITPAVGISLAGSLTQRSAKSILDPLHARAVVLESGGTRIAFVLLDLIALNNDDTARA